LKEASPQTVGLFNMNDDDEFQLAGSVYEIKNLDI